ncbi:hypothetical protein BRC62_06735 [Halobacteriales archaeon QH_10_67_13]|nr:MAG: hypothetical protein BRC62_06735 [Halobacteriales archaeon QH_10_67_13]
MNRRAFLAAGVGAAGLTAGCLGLIVPDEISEQAQPGGLEVSALDETGFSHERTEMIRLEETVSVRGADVAFRVDNWLATFLRRPGPTTPPAQFAVLSTPDVSVLGQQANPIARVDRRVLLEEVADEIGLVGNELTAAGETTATVGPEETETTLSIYETAAELEGQSYDARVTIGKATHDGDWLVIGTSYPAATDDERLARSLAAGVAHPVDPP